MKAYFSASRSYREEYGENYSKIMDVLKKAGCQIMDNIRLTAQPGTFKTKRSDQEKVDLYKDMLKKMDKADMSVFEASFPSTLHIGHEITLSLEKGKPVIVMYHEGHEPILFKGIENEKVLWIEYNSENLEQRLSEAVEDAKKLSDVRFNFFVSPKLLNYLDWVSQNRRIPRSVFLRDLIEKEMRKDKEYKNN